MSIDEEQIVQEETEREDWDSINDKHKKQVKELKRRIRAPTRWQKIVSKQISERRGKQRNKDSENIPKDTKKYKNGKLILPKWALDLFPNMILVEDTVTGEISYSICPFDGGKCELDLDHADCMHCSHNTEEYLEGGYRR